VRIAVMQRYRLQYTFWRRIERGAIREDRAPAERALAAPAHTLGGEMTYPNSVRSSWP
jgi:branched-chain amino acid transport system ATP-binding protein